jgi:Uri superfamily endonuclease
MKMMKKKRKYHFDYLKELLMVSKVLVLVREKFVEKVVSQGPRVQQLAQSLLK